MFQRFSKLAAVAAVVVAASMVSARTASAGVAPTTIGLDTFLEGGVNEGGITFGDKHYSNFNFSSSGDMQLDASDIEMIFAEEDNTQFLAFLMDLSAIPGETSDVVIGYDVMVLDPARHITRVGLLFDGGPLDSSNGRSSATVIETVSTLDGSDLVAGGDINDTAIISVFNNGDEDILPDNFETSLAINPARALRFSKDILVSSREGSAAVGLSVVENSVTQNGNGTVIPLPAAVWAAMPVFGALVGGKRLQRMMGRK